MKLKEKDINPHNLSILKLADFMVTDKKESLNK